MNNAAKELITAWRNLQLKKPPFILDDDRIHVEEKLCHPYRNYRDCVRNPDFGSISSTKFHTGLLPHPYSGDILRAKIYILALNPGFKPLDYYAQDNDADFWRAKVHTLQQRKLDIRYPWYDLNPKFSWTGGAEYWVGRLREIAEKLVERRGIPFAKALSILSTNIACLEFVPYHSKRYKLEGSVVKKMHSLGLMRAFVRDYVLPKAQRGEVLMIVTRHAKIWGPLPRHPKIIVYEGAEARAAYLTLSSRGGKKIAELLGL
jgi:hypothetical protein